MLSLTFFIATIVSLALLVASTNGCGCSKKPTIFDVYDDKSIEGVYRVKVLGKGTDIIEVKKSKKKCYGKKSCDYVVTKESDPYYVVQLIYNFKGCPPVMKRDKFAVAAGGDCDPNLEGLLVEKKTISQVLLFANPTGKTVGDGLPLYESNSCYPNRPWNNIVGKGRKFLHNKRPVCKGKKYCPSGKMPDYKGKCYF